MRKDLRLESRVDVLFVQGNILIDEEGGARLGDFGMTTIMSDPTIVDLISAEGPYLSSVSYMAPELLNPFQFNAKNGNPTKESDIYSLAVTIYEVSAPLTAHGHRQHCLRHRFSQDFRRTGTPATVSSPSTSLPAIDRSARTTPLG